MRHLLKSSACSNAPVARRGMSTASFIVGSVLWIMVLTSLGMIYTKRQKQAEADKEAQEKQAAASDTDSSGTSDEKPDDAVAATTKTIKIGFPTRPLPDFEFPECMGGTISKENMKGKRWVANFVFTRCAGPCPTMTRDMSLLHKRVAKSAPDFQFVTFSVDSSYDNAEVLKKYAETFQAETSSDEASRCT
jgi:cytochrome oxidase Cu insertion factor (SCO1/SenC/PrrC family)